MTRGMPPGDAQDRHALADVVATMVAEVQFTPVRWGTGYDMRQVDHFLDDLVALVRNGHPVASPVELVTFRPSKLREGYQVDEVDDFLDRVVATVAGGHEGGGDTARGDAGTGDAGPARSAEAEPIPEVIVEQRGLLSRLFSRRS